MAAISTKLKASPNQDRSVAIGIGVTDIRGCAATLEATPTRTNQLISISIYALVMVAHAVSVREIERSFCWFYSAPTEPTVMR
jgi:hypothetical protein